MLRVGALLCLVPLGCGRLEFDRRAPSPCPDGYVDVAGSPRLGTEAFCIMRFEAKAWADADGDALVSDAEIDGRGCGPACAANFGVTTHLPVSVPAGSPWRSISQRNAHARCRALGPAFDLVSNPEWMTVARDLELVGANWSGGAPGAGRVAEGHTNGGSPTGPDPLAVSDLADPYDGTGDAATDPPDAGAEQRRTLYLRSGEVVWDFAGNVQEWVDWSPGEPLDAPPACSGGELPTIDCLGLEYDDFNSSTGTYDSSNGVGRLIGGSGDAARRSGQIGDRTEGYAGIYALNMNRFTDMVFEATGFRCVYRPPPAP